MKPALIYGMMPAGEYYLGDIGCAIAEKHREEFFERYEDALNAGKNGFVGKVGGRDVAMISTGGDGGFTVTNGAETFTLSVDAGMIGVMPWDMQRTDAPPYPGALVKFHKDFNVWESELAMHFGRFTIRHIWR